MVTREVQVQELFTAGADVVWALLRNFSGLWHPAIQSICAEDHGKVRKFTIKGEPGFYRERLTYFSDSDRCYSYSHLAGILDVESYEVTLSVQEIEKNSCEVTWRAKIVAALPRANEITEGTREVFLAGFSAIGKLLPKNLLLSAAPAISLTAAGASSATLCLFLHGIGGGRQNWNRQLPIAARHTQAVSMDLRGYNESQLGEAPSTVEDYCSDILRVIKHYNAKHTILCGLSFGAWIATSFAMRHSEKLAGLILTGGCTGMSEADAAERNHFRMSREVPLNAGKTPKDFAPGVVNMIASPLADNQIRDELFSSMAAVPSATYRDALQCFTQPKEKFDFSKMSMPVLLITGEHDRLATPLEIRNVAKRIQAQSLSPDVRFETISNAGHVCNIEAPLAYNILLEDFLLSLNL